MSEHWTDRLSAYIDADLEAGEAERLEAHLATCPACATALAELRAVVTAAAALPAAPQAAGTANLWPAIEARLRPRTADGLAPEVVPIEAARERRERRRVAFSVPQLVAAGLALVVFSAGGAWLALGGAPPSSVATTPSPAGTAAADPGAVTFATSFETAVAELEAEFERRRVELDPQTVLVVERNLAIIDEAITQARQALEADPASGFLNGYVADAMRRKVDLLRQATRIHRAES